MIYLVVHMKVAVGSTNIVKIEAVKHAFASVWPDIKWEVMGVDVSSGVSSQPLTDEETIIGARHRALKARDTCDADYGIGIEGGIQEIDTHFYDSGWVVIVDRKNQEGSGSSLRIVVPPKMMAFISQGKELGEANDTTFQREDIGKQEGHFGTMTNGAITRVKGYTDGVIAALTRFIHPELF